MKNIIKEFKQNSAPGLQGIINLLLKGVSKYTLKLLTKVGNDILFDDIPLLDKWCMHKQSC